MKSLFYDRGDWIKTRSGFIARLYHEHTLLQSYINPLLGNTKHLYLSFVRGRQGFSKELFWNAMGENSSIVRVSLILKNRTNTAITIATIIDFFIVYCSREIARGTRYVGFLVICIASL